MGTRDEGGFVYQVVNDDFITVLMICHCDRLSAIHKGVSFQVADIEV